MFLIIKKYSFIVFIIFIFQCTFDSSQPTSSETREEKFIPENPNPSDKATNQPLTLTLQWESRGALKFDVYLDTINPPQMLIERDINTNKMSVTNLNYNTTYYWKVIAKYDDGTQLAGPVWSFTTAQQSYPSLYSYVMNLYKIETQMPSYVHVIFQVIDLNGKGISTLTQNDFEVYEDGLPISLTESQLEIRNKETIPYKIKTVLMLDNSTSLKNNINEIRDAARSFVERISKNQEISIYSFSEQPHMLIDFTSNRDSLISALNKYISGYATTNLYGAIIKGASLLESKFAFDEIIQSVMIVFTDGSDTQGSSTLIDALNAINNKIVFTIGLGTEIQPEVLKAIGNAGYYSIDKIDELKIQLDKIQEEIVSYANSFYILTYKSPKRGNNNHTLRIRIKNNSYFGERAEIIGSFNSNNFYSN